MLIAHAASPQSAPAGTCQRARYLHVGAHVLDTDTLRVLTAPTPTRLGPKAAAVLLQLVREPGRTHARDELLDTVWKGTCPTPDVLTQAIADLRRAFGDDAQAPRYIETLPRLGYRLLAPVRFAAEDATAASAQALQTGSDTDAAVQAAPAPLPRHALRRLLAVFGAVALLLVAIAGWQRREPVAPTTAHWQVTRLRAITADPGAERSPALSPDGQRVAYSQAGADGRRRVVQRTLAPSHVLPVSAGGDQASDVLPAWSPDGGTLAFLRYEGDACHLLQVPVLGGAPRVLGACGPFPARVDWSPDGRWLAASAPPPPPGSGLAIRVLAADSGLARPFAYARAAADVDLDPRVSPDGRTIAFRRGANPYSDLWVVPAAGGTPRRLTWLASRLRGHDWTRDGSALVFSSSHEGRPALYAVALGDGKVEALGVGPAEFPATARANDTVAYEIPRVRTQLATLALGGRASAPQDLLPSTGSDGSPAPSPVDARLAFVSDRGGRQQLWLRAAAGDAYPLTDDAGPVLGHPAWRRDGRRVLVTARGAGPGQLIEIDPAARRQVVVSPAGEDVRSGVHGLRPDTWMAVVGAPTGGTELVLFDRSGTAPVRRVVAPRVAHVEADAVTGAVYFTRVDQPGLFVIDAADAAPRRLARALDPGHPGGWHVAAGRLYHVVGHASGPGELHVMDPQTGDDRALARLPDDLADFDFGITAAASELVLVRTATQDTDIGVLELRHAGSPR
jgi:Tol biopolymer transport system component/DNA-binding winged helix-turn-helix (wHTH) protein